MFNFRITNETPIVVPATTKRISVVVETTVTVWPQQLVAVTSRMVEAVTAKRSPTSTPATGSSENNAKSQKSSAQL